MKRKLLFAMLLFVGLCFTGCNDDFEELEVKAPTATSDGTSGSGGGPGGGDPPPCPKC